MGIQNRCTVTLGSITSATRAQRALASAAIYSEIIKLGDDAQGRGCTYGLEFGCSQRENVKTVLANAGIRPRSYFDGEGGKKR